MGLKKKSFDSVGTPWCTDFIIINIIINTCPTMGQTPTRERLRMTNDMINQVFWCILFPVLGRGGHSGDVELG